MSKIIKLPKAKPITCKCCGCVYEFEIGDEVETVVMSCLKHFVDENDGVLRTLVCPCCCCKNEIEFEDEKNKQKEGFNAKSEQTDKSEKCEGNR